jgi:hypothetical protein
MRARFVVGIVPLLIASPGLAVDAWLVTTDMLL